MAAPIQPVSNGPRLEMYKMKPYQCIEVVELPDVMYPMKSYYSGPQDTQIPPPSSHSQTPLQCLERRQEDVLKRLASLQSSVDQLSQKYNVTETSQQSTSTASSSSVVSSSKVVQGTAKPSLNGASALDLVISADPECVPWSLVILCEKLSQHFAVLKSTFVHSTVSGSVPDRLLSLLVPNGNGLNRTDSQVVVTLVWKKAPNGPQLVVDPVKQTAIIGEVNIARYLARILSPAYDETDALSATKIDELLDLAQLQILEGKTKEKAAALRTLNSSLGKQEWLTGNGPEPSLADIVCWSALQQSGQASNNPPANVKKWLKLCDSNVTFQKVAALVS